MNIPANQICDHIEGQTSKLRRAISEGDQAAVREATAVIEAYCQLLKGTAPTPIQKQAPQQPVIQQNYATPQPQAATYAKPLVHNGGEIEEKDRNILDF
ncbi:YwdI family protein [Alkalihalobacillus sp. MEB130]|uniref:DUF5327 family protein n=1 Tax=Alkalihalobacillus sp. MEB130 TaxID=2976704 RepID=UPI0028E08284|nr:DUF5327 family protein [Alkalihalobacillus sp. MEB130]MDT8861899.1 YwdI family protein [Alkalihalobacillus sp. MEB130]